MRILLTLIIALIVGCTTAQLPVQYGHGTRVITHLDLHADKAFTPDERAAIVSAANSWETQTDGIAKIDIAWDLDPDSPESIKKHAKDAILLRRESTAELVQLLDMEACMGLYKCVLGWVNIPGGVHNGIDHDEPDAPGRYQMNLIVDRLREDNGLEKVALHEFGHMLGLRHIGDPYATMFPAMRKEKAACLTQPDLQEFCRVNVCGDARLSPCKE